MQRRNGSPYRTRLQVPLFEEVHYPMLYIGLVSSSGVEIFGIEPEKGAEIVEVSAIILHR